jgi:hypothetical protein
MGKNVVIYSDGTGQAGGFRFDEDRSNIYKLYRATRCGPDSSVDPHKQVAFYDPGLGSQADGGHLAGWLARWVYNLVSQATGFGITANIIDCYAALIRLWRPGDRIFLIGFSRGGLHRPVFGGRHCNNVVFRHAKVNPKSYGWTRRRPISSRLTPSSIFINLPHREKSKMQIGINGFCSIREIALHDGFAQIAIQLMVKRQMCIRISSGCSIPSQHLAA